MQVRELHAGSSVERLRAELGDFVLLQHPPGPVYEHLARALGRGATVGMAHEPRLQREILSMLAAFESLRVLGLSALERKGELLVGRASESDVVVHEPSVSTRHAALRWDAEQRSCVLGDLGSRNGTFLNSRRLFGEARLADGDAVSFGDAQFLFMRVESLYGQIASLRAL